ncbi:MAG TPA: two-component regulator propeller domain-containing protein, partial [Bacteroidota bacterium]|nr:two-component regulator propeller domain-containing protein [Bacteroidota bacterium]
GLTDNNVLAITEDQESSIWVSTSDGLNQFKNTNVTTFTTYDGLANDYISSVVETPDRTMYFLSVPGANVTQIKNGVIKKYNISVGPAHVASNGSIWIGQNGYLFNINNNVLKQYDTLSGLPKKWISAITEDGHGLLMYVDHTGIFRFINGRLIPFTMSSGQQFPKDEYVVCFHPQKNGLLWIGTADYLVKVENGTMTDYTTKDGLAGNWVSFICDDLHGGLWISSPQGGLTHYVNGKFIVYNSRVGLFTDQIFCVLTDNNGDLWLSSPQGIGTVKHQAIEEFESGHTTSIKTKVYLTADGMKTDECFGEWVPAGWKTHDGRIWFATKRGAAVIDPDKLVTNTLPPPVLIEEIVANQRTILTESNFTLPASTRRIEFHYTALSYLNPERVRFKVLLEGYDHEWVDEGTHRIAIYTNLPPGKYRFRVMACNNDGVWNEAGARVSFELEPYFFQTLWFYALLAVAIIGVGFGIYRLRVWQLLKREKELKARIDEALANIKVLGGLIPICANCKKIRDDKGYWDHLEGYIQSHSEAHFTHGICPDCAKKLYPNLSITKKSS